MQVEFYAEAILCAHERTVLPIADKLAERLYRKGSAVFIQKQYNRPVLKPHSVPFLANFPP